MSNESWIVGQGGLCAFAFEIRPGEEGKLDLVCCSVQNKANGIRHLGVPRPRRDVSQKH